MYTKNCNVVQPKRKLLIKRFKQSVLSCVVKVSNKLLLLLLPPRYQPIWTIYIPFESPWLIDFINVRFDLNFWCCNTPCGATLCKLVLPMSITAWEQKHTRKTIWLKIFPNLLYYQFISKLLLYPAPYVIYQWRNVHEKILTTSNFGQVSLCLLR